MAVDVVTETLIQRPIAAVAAYAADPTTAPRWYENIKAASWDGPAGLRVGNRIRFEARFLGRTLRYVYEIVEHVPERRFVMRTAQGPFPMETTYEWEPVGKDATRMRLRNRGQPAGFSKVMAPMMAKAMRRANEKDLARIKGILESAGGKPT